MLRMHKCCVETIVQRSKKRLQTGFFIEHLPLLHIAYGRSSGRGERKIWAWSVTSRVPKIDRRGLNVRNRVKG